MNRALALLAVALLAVIAFALAAPYAARFIEPPTATAAVYHSPRYDAAQCAAATTRERQAEHDAALAPTQLGLSQARITMQQAQGDMNTYC